MVCEEFREGMMALLDGEIANDQERADIERHVATCPCCGEDYRSFRDLGRLTDGCLARATRRGVSDTTASAFVATDDYFRCVCRKMECAGSWRAWTGVSAALMGAGLLMIFGFQGRPLAIAVGAVAIAWGAGLLWLGRFCACTRRSVSGRC